MFPHQENTPGGRAKEEGPVIAVTKAVKTSTAANHTADLSEPKHNEVPELLTNELMVDKGNTPQGCGHTTCTPYVLIKIQANGSPYLSIVPGCTALIHLFLKVNSMALRQKYDFMFKIKKYSGEKAARHFDIYLTWICSGGKNKTTKSELLIADESWSKQDVIPKCHWSHSDRGNWACLLYKPA